MTSTPGLSYNQLRVVLRGLIDHTLVNNLRICVAITHLLFKSGLFLFDWLLILLHLFNLALRFIFRLSLCYTLLF